MRDTGGSLRIKIPLVKYQRNRHCNEICDGFLKGINQSPENKKDCGFGDCYAPGRVDLAVQNNKEVQLEETDTKRGRGLVEPLPL